MHKKSKIVDRRDAGLNLGKTLGPEIFVPIKEEKPLMIGQKMENNESSTWQMLTLKGTKPREKGS